MEQGGIGSSFAPGFFSRDSAAVRCALGREASALPWLPVLLDAYAFLDQALESELRRLGRKPVCGAGCYACCLQPIPATPVEILGLRVALASVPAGEAPAAKGNAAGTSSPYWHCPFLANGSCSVYAVRPFACRRFLVFSRPCARGEDPTAERPEDVHQPSENALLHALRLTLPAYRLLGERVGDDEGRPFFNRRTLLLQNIRW